MRTFAAAFAFAVFPAMPAVAQSFGYAFEGQWDCGAGIFTFTDQTYDNGSDTLQMTDVQEGSGDFVLRFADGYEIALSEVTETSMQWQSGATGGTLTCDRVR